LTQIKAGPGVEQAGVATNIVPPWMIRWSDGAFLGVTWEAVTSRLNNEGWLVVVGHAAPKHSPA
jgi:hypothetical protein